MNIRQQANQRPEAQSPAALDSQIRFVQQRIKLRRYRVRGHTHQIKERAKTTLASPFALISAALFGMALSRSRNRSGASLLQTFNLALLIFSRLSVLAKTRPFEPDSAPRKTAEDDLIVPPGRTPKGSWPEPPSTSHP